MTEQLIQLAQQADAVLDAQAEAFDQLRQLEKNAPEVLDQVATDQAGLDARIDAAAVHHRRAEEDLSRRRSRQPWPGVPAQARKLDGVRRDDGGRSAARCSRRRRAPRSRGGRRGARRSAGGRPGRAAAGERRPGRRAIWRRRPSATPRPRPSSDPQLQRRPLAGVRRPGLHHHAPRCGRRDRAHPHLRGRPGTSTRPPSLAASDPSKALAEAQEAERLAAAALDLAHVPTSSRPRARSRAAAEPGHRPAGQRIRRRDPGRHPRRAVRRTARYLRRSSSGGSRLVGGGWSSGGSSGGGWSSSGWGGGSSHHSSGGRAALRRRQRRRLVPQLVGGRRGGQRPLLDAIWPSPAPFRPIP